MAEFPPRLYAADGFTDLLLKSTNRQAIHKAAQDYVGGSNILGPTDQSGNRWSADSGTRTSRVLMFGDDGSKIADYPTKQLFEDPFSQIASYGKTLRQPPYQFEQLALLAEAVPVHSSAIEQRVLDVVGSGVKFLPMDSHTKHVLPKTPVAVDSTEAAAVSIWFESLFENTSVEEMAAAWDDFVTLGWGFLEVVREPGTAKVKRLYYVPAHTIRAHSDGNRFAQIRNGRFQWFKRWGVETDLLARTGNPAPPKTPFVQLASELMVFRKPARRSSWYGIPPYISAVGYISLAVAARDWNILFFENMREPRHLIVMTGTEENLGPAINDLEQSMRAQLSEPHKNIVLPVTGDVKVTIEKLMVAGEVQFQGLIEKCDAEVLVGHRMPPDRIGIVRATGLVGGSTSQIINVVNSIYKEGVVSKDQDIFENRIDTFCKVEYERATGDPYTVHADFQELDVSDVAADAAVAVMTTKNNMTPINEARIQLGRPPLPQFRTPPIDALGQPTDQHDMTLTEYIVSLGGPAVQPGGLGPASNLGNENRTPDQMPEGSGGNPQGINSRLGGPVNAQNLDNGPHAFTPNLQALQNDRMFQRDVSSLVMKHSERQMRDSERRQRAAKALEGNLTGFLDFYGEDLAEQLLTTREDPSSLVRELLAAEL